MQAKLAVLNKLLTHYGKQNWWNHSNRLVDWVSMILIQQTTQLNVERALANLEGKLSVAVLHAMGEEELQALIRPAGFYKQKSSYIKALMLYIFRRNVFIADQYALRLFTRLGLTTATTYKALRAECMPLVADISLETCQEWHAVIDEHGKAYRRGHTDEAWLRQ